jgi:hypothetical protein
MHYTPWPVNVSAKKMSANIGANSHQAIFTGIVWARSDASCETESFSKGLPKKGQQSARKPY